MARGAPPVFLARARYRQRRLRDALWLMPVLGALAFAVPLLWPDAMIPNARALVYLFCVWAALIALGAGLAAFLRRDDEDEDRPGPDLPGPDVRGPGLPSPGLPNTGLSNPDLPGPDLPDPDSDPRNLRPQDTAGRDRAAPGPSRPDDPGA